MALLLPLVDGRGRWTGSVLLVSFLCLFVCAPLMHGAMRRYTHRNLRYGELAASFDVPKRRFYAVLLKALVPCW